MNCDRVSVVNEVEEDGLILGLIGSHFFAALIAYDDLDKENSFLFTAIS